ncbi:MAG: hypothetical protein IJQ60_10095, partial [Prevotella sp.]|nr:hypothetical protein [Prevotella sp.]
IIYSIFLWREIFLAHEETVLCALCALESQNRVSFPEEYYFSKRAFFCVFFEDLFGNTLNFLYLCNVERKNRSAGH